jgi:hypothetical protein
MGVTDAFNIADSSVEFRELAEGHDDDARERT